MVDGFTLDQLSAMVALRASSEDTVERLAVAAALAGEVRDLADELLDRHVAAAREDQRSWSEIGAVLGVREGAAQLRFVRPPVRAEAWPKDFDGDARRLVHAGMRHARGFRHRYLGTEHLLLALTADSGLAGATLARLGVGHDQVAERILALIGPGHSSESATLGIAPRTKRVLETAGNEARRLGHRCATAAPEHVLLALSRHDDTVAARILRELGASDTQVRRQLSDLLAREAPELASRLLQSPRRRLRRGLRRQAA